MVQLVPNTQEATPPSYIGMSQAISPFAVRADRSGYIATAGAGELLGEVTKGADNTIKSVIDNAINTGVDQQREGFTGALEQIAGFPQANRVADYQPTSTSITSSDSPTVPAGVQAGVNSAGNVISAAATGKFTPTYYTGRLDMIAKDLRSQFAGHRDYIDQEIAQKTGGNPANEYIKQLLTQINAGVQNNLSEKEKDLSFIRENAGIPGAAAMYQARQNGTITGPQVIQWASGAKSIELGATLAKANFDTKNYSYQDGNLQAKEYLNNMAPYVINQGFVTLGTALGGTKRGINFSDAGGMIQKLSSGDLKLSEDDATKLAYSFSVFEDNIKDQIRNNLIKSGAAKYMQPSEIEAQVNEVTKPIDSIVSHLTNKEYGPAYADFNAVRSITDNSEKSLMTSTNTTVSNYMKFATAIQKVGGNTAGVRVAQDAIADGLPAALREVLGTAKLDIATQTDPNKPATLSDYIDKLQKAGVGVDADPNKPSPAKKVERAAYDSITNIVQKAVDPTLPAEIRANIYKGVYGKGNENLLDKFAMDGVDKNGNVIPGQNVLFRKLTDPKTTDEAWNMRNQGHPEAWDNYKNTTENWFGKLFGTNIRNLNDLAVNPNLKMTYNSETHHIGINFADTFFTTPYTKGGDTGIQDALANKYRIKIAEINSGIDSMANIAKKEGTDINAYVLTNLRSQNLDPSSIGFKVQRAVEASGQPQPQTQPQQKSGDIPRPDQLVGSLIPQGVKDYVKSKMDEPFQFPTLQDFTGSFPRPANVDENGIKGTANAAHVSPQWGNPFSPSFKDEHLTAIQAPNGKPIQVNKYAAPAFEGFLKDLSAAGYPVKDVQGYSLREKRGVGGISQHAFGNAIDINPDENPTGSNGKLPANVSEMAAKWGLTWGGDWSKRYKDPMHFEFTGKMPNIKEPGFKAASK